MTDDNTAAIRPGRPRKARGERRDDWIGLRATPAERAAWEARAAQAGLPLSEFCRRAIEGAKIEPPANDQAAIPPALLAQLGRVGNNLNQIAHAAHLGRELRHMAEAALSEVRALVSKISARLDR